MQSQVENMETEVTIKNDSDHGMEVMGDGDTNDAKTDSCRNYDLEEDDKLVYNSDSDNNDASVMQNMKTCSLEMDQVEYDRNNEYARCIVIETVHKALDVLTQRKDGTLSEVKSGIQSKIWSFLATNPGGVGGREKKCSVGNCSFTKKRKATGGKKSLAKKQGPKVTIARKRKIDDFNFELSGHKMKKIKEYFYVESEQSTDNNQKMEPPVIAPDESRAAIGQEQKM